MGSEDAEELGMWGCRDIGMQEQGHMGAGTHGCKDSEMQGNRDALCGDLVFQGCEDTEIWDTRME